MLPQELPPSFKAGDNLQPTLSVVNGTFEGSFFHELPNETQLKLILLDPESKQQKDLLHKTNPIEALATFFEQTGVITPYIDKEKVLQGQEHHPGFLAHSIALEKQNRNRNATLKLIDKAYEFYQSAYFTDKGTIDPDALEQLIDDSDQLLNKSPLLRLLTAVNASARDPEITQNSPSIALVEAERLLRIIVLNEVDRLR